MWNKLWLCVFVGFVVGLGTYWLVRDGWPAYEGWRWRLLMQPLHLERLLDKAEFEGRVVSVACCHQDSGILPGVTQGSIHLIFEITVRLEQVLSDSTGRLTPGLDVVVLVSKTWTGPESSFNFFEDPQRFLESFWLGKRVRLEANWARWKELQDIWLFWPRWHAYEGWVVITLALH